MVRALLARGGSRVAEGPSGPRAAHGDAHVPLAQARALPLVGHALAFRADKLGFLLHCSRQADVVELRLGRARTFLLGDPEDVRHVLVTDHRRLAKHDRLLRPADPALFGTALVGAPKSRHASERRGLQPAYHQQHLPAFAGAIEACVDEHLESWRGGREVDVAEEAVALAQRIRIRVLLGSEGAAAATELLAALEARQRFVALEFLSPIPHAGRLPTRTRRRYRRAQTVIREAVAAAIAAHRSSPGREPTFLGRLLETQSDGNEAGDRRVLDEARTFLASYEVSSRALAWSLFLLAAHEDTQERLARDGGPDLVGFPQMVFSEALRLYPPSWLFVRMARADVRLPSGPSIPKGSRLFLSPYTAHRDERHFPEPERFDPARWEPGGPELAARPRYAYFPFGGGPHVCIGEGFARMEAALVLPRVVRRFELTPAPGAHVEPRPRVTLELSGAPLLQVRPRATGEVSAPSGASAVRPRA